MHGRRRHEPDTVALLPRLLLTQPSPPKILGALGVLNGALGDKIRPPPHTQSARYSSFFGPSL